MHPSKYAIYTIEQIRQIENTAQTGDTTQDMLMQRAGKAAFDCLSKHWPFAKKIGIVCGPGNNGGDGYVLAKYLYERGLEVKIWYVGSLQKQKPAAFKAYEACKNLPITIEPANQSGLAEVEVVVDAICGIGLTGTLDQSYIDAIEQINALHLPVLSLDVPSGLDADTGQADYCIKAKATVTFIGLKWGLMTGKGLIAAGEICVDHLAIPEELFQVVTPLAVKLSLAPFAHFLAHRPRDWHKGNAGHVLIVGGAEGMSGAVRMAGESALRAGAGLVTVATASSHASLINITRPELMSVGVASGKELSPLLAKASVVLIGPGLGQSEWAKDLLQVVMDHKIPLIVDADALNLLAQQPVGARHDWILTPHPGEAARLLQETVAMVQKDRIQAVTRLQKTYRGIAVLKGAGTLIASEEESLALCAAGNPGMATAGMGDVLGGIITSFVAQGASLADAAKLGVYLHAKAGDLAASDGERGMCALDLLPHLRALINGKSYRAET